MGETRVFAAELWLQLSFAVSGHQELLVSYDNMFAENGGGILVDAAGNAVPFFSDQPVQNDARTYSRPDRAPAFELSTEDLTPGDWCGTTTGTITPPIGSTFASSWKTRMPRSEDSEGLAPSTNGPASGERRLGARGEAPAVSLRRSRLRTRDQVRIFSVGRIHRCICSHR